MSISFQIKGNEYIKPFLGDSSFGLNSKSTKKQIIEAMEKQKGFTRRELEKDDNNLVYDSENPNCVLVFIIDDTNELSKISIIP